MKVIIIALALVAIATAAPAVEERVIVHPDAIKILRSLFEPQPAGGYIFGFESEDGITREETGELVQIIDEENKPQTVVAVRGSYSYYNDKGELETMTYTADEKGFHPEGPSIPKVVAPVARR